jgi:hypothetical protein
VGDFHHVKFVSALAAGDGSSSNNNWQQQQQVLTAAAADWQGSSRAVPSTRAKFLTAGLLALPQAAPAAVWQQQLLDSVCSQ